MPQPLCGYAVVPAGGSFRLDLFEMHYADGQSALAQVSSARFYDRLDAEAHGIYFLRHGRMCPFTADVHALLAEEEIALS
jgi:hypothetical protein